VGNIRLNSERFINLAAGVVTRVNMRDFPVNLVIVRNPSATDTVLFGNDEFISTTRFQTFADVNGGGYFVRPEKIEEMFFLSAGNINRVILELYFVEDPAVFVIGSTKPPATNVNIIGSVGLTLGAEIPAGTKNIGDVDIASLPAGVAVKVTAAAPGDVVVKATPGIVAAIRAMAGTNVTLKDNATERWYVAAGGKDDFPFPIACGTNITLNFSAAGDAYIIYQ
jgi:hypothetical protein